MFAEVQAYKALRNKTCSAQKTPTRIQHSLLADFIKTTFSSFDIIFFNFTRKSPTDLERILDQKNLGKGQATEINVLRRTPAVISVQMSYRPDPNN